MNFLLAAALAALPFAAAAAGPARVAVDNLQVLLVAAIDAEDGQAHGILASGDARAITERFRAQGPLNVDVSTLKRYRQPGCRRLNVRFLLDHVTLPGKQAPENRTIDVGLNYCRDGTPPRSLD